MTPVPAVATSAPVRLVADLRGGHVGLVEAGRVLLLELPSLSPTAEVGIPGDLADHDVAFVGTSGRLAVLSRSAGRAVLYVVDPAGPTKLGEVAFRAPARIVAVAGSHVVTVAGNVTAVVDVSSTERASIPLPTRGIVSLAARIGPTEVALAIGGAIEQWDVEKRTPGRRLRLDRPIDPLFIGGNADRFWVIARDTPNIVELISLATRSTKKIELPEPAHAVDAHPSGELLAVIGATTRGGFVIDLARAGEPLRLERGALAAITWVDRGDSLVVKPEDGALELLGTGGDDEASPEPDPREPRSTAASAATRGAAPAATAAAGSAPAKPGTAQWSRDEISRRLAAWRARFQADEATGASLDPDSEPDDPDRDPPPADGADDGEAEGAEAAAPRAGRTASLAGTPPAPVLVAVPDSEVSAPVPLAHPGGWRAHVADWARSILGGSTRGLPPGVDTAALATLAARAKLPASLVPALALLYGAYLLGTPEVAPIELATVTDFAWHEALHHGALAASGITRVHRGRVRLVAEARAVLDDAPPLGRTDRPERAALEARLRGLLPGAS